MIIVYIITVLMIGGLVAWFAGRVSQHFARNFSLATVLVAFVLAIQFCLGHYAPSPEVRPGGWMMDIKYSWIPQFGISFHLGVDGLSLVMILLTLFLGVLGVLISWNEIKERTGFYYFNLLWILAGIIGVFTALDLFLFYFFWEIMLIPMYFLIGIWGHENRMYAAFKFFLFTQASGLLMFLAILGLAYFNANHSGTLSFDYFDLMKLQPAGLIGFLLMSGFLIAFAVKLPVVPVHNWLPDAHTQAPTAGSLILAGLLLKTGAYGIIRFVVPFFHESSHAFAPYGMALGAIGILYGAKLAYSQTDLKRLVAYTSVSHMGFVMLGVFAFNELAYQGVVMQMITHGISTGALFIFVGMIYERTHTRDINQLGGLWESVPKFGAVGIIFSMASLGLPGLGNFIAEFLVLSGSFQASKVITAIASVGLVLGTVYSLRIFQRVFHGNKNRDWSFKDMTWREVLIMGSLVIAIVWLGWYPQTVINLVKPAINLVLEQMAMFAR
jgi:NADH-quinone oxidoreductase subunit M